MVPVTARKGAACYRYYVTTLPNDRNKPAQSLTRLRAVDLETAVIKALHNAMEANAAEPAESASSETQRAFLDEHLERLTLGAGQLEIRFRRSEHSGPEVLSVPWSAVNFRRKRQIIPGETTSANLGKPIRSDSSGSSKQSRKAATGSHSS